MSATKLEVLKTWNSLGRLFGKQIDPEMAELMFMSVSDLPLDAVLSSLRAWPSHNRAFPMPADIRASIEGVKPKAADEKDEGLVIANKIWACVVKHGHPWPGRAKAELGERGWAIVEMLGGWVSLCQTLSEDTRGTFIAQTRDLVAADSRVNRPEATPGLEADRFVLPPPTLKVLN